MTCTDTQLQQFGKEHYTFINQIFGDTTVREIISEVFPSEEYEFRVESASSEFDAGSEHHYLYNKKRGTNICSVKNKHQNMLRDKNDTLCQSYSLLTYFGIKISPKRKNRQVAMCNMYRIILNNEVFMRRLNDEIVDNSDNKMLWRLYTSNKNGTQYVNMNISYIREQLLDVLSKWESYGYLYFMDEGSCN